ncbi:hypothetical protein FACS1894191_8360 [Clostridia bacterium]|nr:hypothetical protein FACS1894191_8360 [Clostridia bacterium]
MYLSNADIELLRLAGWCKNLPADIGSSFHAQSGGPPQIFHPAGIALLDRLGLLMVTRNGQSIRLREKGWRLLRHLGYDYHKDTKYKSDYER